MSNQWEVINLEIVSGNSEKILKREKVTGVVEIIPPPIKDGEWAWILRPIESLHAEQVIPVDHAKLDSDDPYAERQAEEDARARRDRFVFGNAGFKIRKVMGLCKKDAFKAFGMKSGEVLTFKKCGWGETFTYQLKKIN